MTYLPRCVTCDAVTLTRCGACDLSLCSPVCAIAHGLAVHSYGALRRRYTLNAAAEQARARRRQQAAR